MHWYKELNEPTFVCVCVWGGGGGGGGNGNLGEIMSHDLHMSVCY